MIRKAISLLLLVGLIIGMIPTLQVNAEGKFGNTISAGKLHSMVIKKDGSLWAWGRNNLGQLGNGGKGNATEFFDYKFQTEPVKIMDNVISVSTSGWHTMAIKNDGSLWAWGYNEWGQIGDGTTETKLIPVKIMENVSYINAGEYNSMVIKDDGSLWTWGWNESGQLGNGGEGNALGPFGTKIQTVPVKIMDNVKYVSGVGWNTMAIKKDGSLWAWGRNDEGQLLNGGKTNAFSQSGIRIQTIPIKIMDDVIDASAGSSNVVAIKSDGSLLVWGCNDFAQLGDGTKINRIDPVKIMDDTINVSAFNSHSIALKKDGSLWGWGTNDDGQLGDGTKEDKSAPVKIIDGVIYASAGCYHTMVIKNDGSLWAWGSNEYSEVGVGILEDKVTPVKVMDGIAIPYKLDISGDN